MENQQLSDLKDCDLIIPGLDNGFQTIGRGRELHIKLRTDRSKQVITISLRMELPFNGIGLKPCLDT